MVSIKSLFFAVLVTASAVSAAPRPQATESSSSSLTSTPSATSTNSRVSSTGSATASPTPSIDASAPINNINGDEESEEESDDASNDGGSYYPDLGFSYDDDPNAAVDQTPKDPDGDNTAFMSMNTTAQIGIIVAVVVGALGLFGGVVAYYFHRRKQWQKELVRRSQVLVIKKQEQNKEAGSRDMERGTTTTIECAVHPDIANVKPGWKYWFGGKSSL